VRPGEEAAFRAAAANTASRLALIPQPAPLGYGHAIKGARQFAGERPFLHLIGDHAYVSELTSGDSPSRCAQQLGAVAEAENCALAADCESLLRLLGYTAEVEITAA
jgi:UTP--glucose-1-phosphate uridylyltransferase